MASLNRNDCGIDVHRNGDVAFSAGDQSLRLTIPAGSAEARVDEIGDGFRIHTNSGIFRIERTVSLRERKDYCLLFVTCRVAADRAGRIEGLTDRWSLINPSRIDYRWAPNLRPYDEMRIGSHCFRSPVVIASSDRGWAALIPDFDSDDARADAHRCALDLDGAASGMVILGYGVEPTVPTGHVYFVRDGEVEAAQGDTYRFDYHLILGHGAGRGDALRSVNAFIWQRFATPYLADKRPQTVPFDRYAEYAYPSLVVTPPFTRFELEGEEAGGISAEATHAEYFRRPHPVVWNQYWFNNQRSAYGLGLLGKIHGKHEWIQAARLMTATTVGAPSWGGLQPALYAYESREWWGSIPRLNGGRERVHVADAAQTGGWLLRWEKDVESSGRGLEIVRRLADTLCRIQESDGSIAPWFDWDGASLQPDEILRHSAETGAATAFLGEVAMELDDASAAGALIRGADYLASEVMPTQRYQDFETFFSCSPKDLDMSDPHTGIHPQNSLAVFWTARTMLLAYRLTGTESWLDRAIDVTDSLSLYQQVWNPPFLSLYTFGGFGVMNTDAEWNDARQALFAPHYFDMYDATGLPEYLERGRAAVRASFVLASIPENADVNPKHFDTYPPGLMAENYGHSGRDTPAGRSDACWGEAGALTSVALIQKRHPGLLDDLGQD